MPLHELFLRPVSCSSQNDSVVWCLKQILQASLELQSSKMSTKTRSHCLGPNQSPTAGTKSTVMLLKLARRAATNGNHSTRRALAKILSSQVKEDWIRFTEHFLQSFISTQKWFVQLTINMLVLIIVRRWGVQNKFHHLHIHSPSVWQDKNAERLCDVFAAYSAALLGQRLILQQS